MNQQSSKNRMSKRNIALVGAGVVLTIAVIVGLSNLFQSQKTPRISQLEQMQQVDSLTHRLEIESYRGTEYFNSQAYESLVNVPRLQADASPLAARIIEPNRRYLLTLLALRKISVNTYREQLDTDLKTGILVDALNQAVYFNAWGLPHLYSEAESRPEPVQAIIDLGRPALNRLRPLLSQKRKAPRWGSEEDARDGEHEYRVADYAIALIHAIEGKPFPNRAERDNMIENHLQAVASK